MQRELYEQSRDSQEAPACFRAKNNACYAHFHSSIELVYTLSGTLSAMMDGQRYDISAGSMLISSGYAVHRYFTEESSDVIVLIFPISFIPSLEKLLSAKQFTAYSHRDTGKLFEGIFRSMHKQWESLGDEAKRGYAQLILGLLIDRVGLADIPKQAPAGLVRSLLSYMQQNYTSPLSVESLAKKFGYSRSRLSHIFRDHFGCSFSEYVHGLRCRQAASLLRESDLTILEISMVSGFECIRTFYRAFKQCYGMTPTQYAKGEAAAQAQRG